MQYSCISKAPEAKISLIRFVRDWKMIFVGHASKSYCDSIRPSPWHVCSRVAFSMGMRRSLFKMRRSDILSKRYLIALLSFPEYCPRQLNCASSSKKYDLKLQYIFLEVRNANDLYFTYIRTMLPQQRYLSST